MHFTLQYEGSHQTNKHVSDQTKERDSCVLFLRDRKYQCSMADILCIQHGGIGLLSVLFTLISFYAITCIHQQIVIIVFALENTVIHKHDQIGAGLANHYGCFLQPERCGRYIPHFLSAKHVIAAPLWIKTLVIMIYN